MNPSSGNTFSFLPWVMNKLTTKASIAPNTTTLRPTVSVKLRLSVSGGGPTTLDVVQPVAVHGPGDVIGLQPEAVLKTTPPAGEQKYPPGLLASLEFGEEDLPWRYSPEGIPVSGQVNPWCFLLVVKADEFTTLPQGSAPLPAIQVTHPDLVFPDPATRWAWAHVQTNVGLGDITARTMVDADVTSFLGTALRDNPDLAFSRIFSPRHLAATTAYHAFLVPSYEVGRLAGLGLNPPANLTSAQLEQLAKQCAWAARSTATAFPVYYQWAFQTDEAGDFESLARLIKPEVLVDFGTQPLALTTPVSSADTTSPVPKEYILNLPGIIEELGAPVMHVPSNIAKGLYQTIAAPPRPRPRRPLVAPPIYGRAYTDRNTLHDPAPASPATPAATTWLDQVNLHPGYRGMASIGSQVIQDNQEEYMQRAWAQVRDIIAANMNLRGMQSGLETTDSLRQQHLPLTGSNPLNPVTNLVGNRAAPTSDSTFGEEFSAAPNEAQQAPAPTAESAGNSTPSTAGGSTEIPQDGNTSPPGGANSAASTGNENDGLENYGLHLTGLSFTRIQDQSTGLTLLETVRQSDAPLAAFSPAFRRILKPFGRYQTRQGATPAGRPLRPTQQAPTISSNPTQLEPGLSLQQRDLLLAEIVRGTVTAARPKYPYVLGYQFADSSVQAVMNSLVDHEGIKEFWAMDGGEAGPKKITDTEKVNQFIKAFASLAQVKFAPEPIVPKPLNLAALKQAVIEGSKPGPIFLARANRAIRFLPHYSSNASSAGPILAARGLAPTSSTANATPTPTTPTLTAVKPIMAYPVFKDPMGPVLQQRHPEMFLPNVSAFPSNAVTLLEYNHAFIEAYMLGLNHAFGSELQWRDYPTDLRGSYFRQFWDASEAIHLESNDTDTLEQLAALEEKYRDIAPINTWQTNDLGKNPANLALQPTLLLAVRADLLKRYPNTVVCAAPGKGGPPGSTNLIEPNLSAVVYPTHRSMLGQDIILFSFALTINDIRLDWGASPKKYGHFFIFHERPGEPQFGLDEATVNNPPSPSKWDDLSWGNYGDTITGSNSNISSADLNQSLGSSSSGPVSDPDPFSTITDSAKFAYATFQQPFLVAIHGSTMINS